jgi:hypothetical protein
MVQLEQGSVVAVNGSSESTSCCKLGYIGNKGVDLRVKISTSKS